ncbi:telomere repeats-binding bouquet formation protein 1-like, partial [Hippocampus comes]
MFVEKRHEEESGYNERCAGCVLPFERVTSRTFASVLDVCHQKCEMHKVLLEATARFNAPQRRSLVEGELEMLEPAQLKPEKESVGAPQRTLASWRLPCLDLK